MRKLLTLAVIAAFAVAISVSAAGASPAKASHAKTVTVAMHDPGCHWFLVKGKYLKTLKVSGPISLVNFDEATIKVAGRSGLKLVKIGHKLPLLRGTYHITMVGQASDDNHLLLVIK